MIDDLLSLRILLLLDSAAQCEMLRRGAASSSIPVDIIEASTAEQACDLAVKNDVDVLFVSAALPGSDRAAVVARARSTKRNPFVFEITPAATAERADAAGSDGAIVMPADADRARTLIDRCGTLHTQRRVLIVDDSPTMRSIVRKILAASRFHFEMSDASQAAEALTHMERGQFDLVFLDYHMPDLNGLKALARIRQSYPDLHVVVMTAIADEALADRAQRAGAAAFLKKPFYPADIDAIMHCIFGLRGLPN